jgi:hypothetical protein
MTDSPTAPTAPAPEPPPTPKLPEFPATLAEAVVRALADLPNIVRDREANIPGKEGKPGYSYKYVDLATTIEKVKPVLARWGLALLQDVAGDGKTVTVTTTLLHVSGETRMTPELGMAAGATPQATGSAITYARRYQAMAVLGLAPDDDDGQAAAAAPYIERLPIEQRSDVTVSRASAEAYVALCEKRGLTMDHIKAIVQRVTGGRTDQPALVLEAEVDALTAATKDVVERRRQTDQERAARTGTPAPQASPPAVGPWGPYQPAPTTPGEAPEAAQEPSDAPAATDTAPEPPQRPTAPQTDVAAQRAEGMATTGAIRDAFRAADDAVVTRETTSQAVDERPGAIVRHPDDTVAAGEAIIAEAQRSDLTVIRTWLVAHRQSVQGNAATIRARYARERCKAELDGYDPFEARS